MNEFGKYDSVLIAKYMLALAASKGKSLNNTQLQKLLFIAYGSYLTKNGELLINEAPKAWPYGPVFPKVQKKIKAPTLSLSLNDPELATIKQDEDVTILFKEVIDSYSRFSARQLTDWSHSKGSPWTFTTQLPNFDWGTPIPNEFIKQYFAAFNV